MKQSDLISNLNKDGVLSNTLNPVILSDVLHKNTFIINSVCVCVNDSSEEVLILRNKAQYPERDQSLQYLLSTYL